MTTDYKLYSLETGYFLKRKFSFAWESSKKLFEEEGKKDKGSHPGKKKTKMQGPLPCLSYHFVFHSLVAVSCLEAKTAPQTENLHSCQTVHFKAVSSLAKSRLSPP